MLNILKGLLKPFSLLIENKEMIYSMAKKDVIGRYRGSVLGILWSFFNPLFMLGLYTFFFRFVFKAKWPDVGDTTADYAVMLFAGLVVHAMASDMIGRSAGTIVGNANLVKKVVFPVVILPWVTLLSSLFHMLISMIVLVMFFLISGGVLQWTLLLLPLILVPLVILFMGVGWFFSALGVYLRDIEQIMGTLITFLLFTSTVFFSIDHAPSAIKPLLMLNPITQIINDLRNILVYGLLPDFASLGIYSIVAIVVFYIGFAFFNKVQRGFADVL
ncbi:ABC transporter permease [Vibrio fluvialis]|nr:ABC transporter permease [Vibrio fluvialis]